MPSLDTSRARSDPPNDDHGFDRVRVLVAEDEVTLREAIVDLVSAHPGFSVVAEAGNAADAIDLARTMLPDVLLLDVKMPAGGGARVAREVRSMERSPRVVALSAYDDRATVMQMLRAGASAYVLKRVAMDEILEGIRAAAAGESYLSKEVAGKVVHELVGLLDERERTESRLKDHERAKAELIEQLSDRMLALLGDVDQHRGAVARLAAGIKAIAQEDFDPRWAGPPVPLRQVVEGALLELEADGERVRVDDAAGALDRQAWIDGRRGVRALVAVLDHALAASRAHIPIGLAVEARNGRIQVVVEWETTPANGGKSAGAGDADATGANPSVESPLLELAAHISGLDGGRVEVTSSAGWARIGVTYRAGIPYG